MFRFFNEMFYLLMFVCLNEWILQDILIVEVELIVLRWLSYVLQYYCKKKLKCDKIVDILLKLYLYVGKIVLFLLLCLEFDFKRNLDKKVFEYLKEFEIIDIVNVVFEMIKLENGVVEEIFRDYVRELFKQGL